MVMGQEEKKNKSRLEKAQVALTGSNAEYEAAIKALEETTGRWNRDWKAACDKFQDLEEERIDFVKSSCWTFANISSTVCVSDDASCEKVRISLEECEVEKDINSFIDENGTGQEIPDAPKYINFVRGDISDDSASEVAEEHYSLAQFPRAGNPTFRSASPNPSSSSGSAYEPPRQPSPEPEPEPKKSSRRDRDKRDRRESSDRRRRNADEPSSPLSAREVAVTTSASRRDDQSTASTSRRHDQKDIQNVPHNEYPLDGMTMYCRPGAMISDGSSHGSPVALRPDSSHESSEYSNPTTISSASENQALRQQQQQQQVVPASKDDDNKSMKRKSGFFSGGGPFRRKSRSEKIDRQQQRELALQAQRQIEAERLQQEQQAVANRPTPNTRNTWSPAVQRNEIAVGQNRPGPGYGSATGRQQSTPMMLGGERSNSPDPIDPRASIALNVGGNVFDVAPPANEQRQLAQQPPLEPEASADPIAQALAELKGVTKNSIGRNSADRYYGIATPAPSATPRPGSSVAAAQRGTPPPTYIPKTSALDLPPPAFTSAQMQQTTQRYIAQRENILDAPQMPAASESGSTRQRSKTLDYQRPQSTHGSREVAMTRDDPRAASPNPNRSVSPRPQIFGDDAYRNSSPKPQSSYSRGPSPNPYTQSRPGTAQSNRPPGQYAAYGGGSPGPGQELALSGPQNTFRGASPAPSSHSRNDSYNARSRSRAGSIRDGYGSNNGRHSVYEGSTGGGAVQMYQSPQQMARPRSKSQAGNRQFASDGRPILYYGMLLPSALIICVECLLTRRSARAMYQYSAAIPEELGFAKGDIVAVLRQQDDGWWEAELVGVQGRPGLVPSNYLQAC